MTLQNKKPVVYLASPFFTPKQAEFVRKLESAIESCGYICLSPSRDGTVVRKGDTREVWNKAFEWNVSSILGCDLVVANIDDRDTGTSWEMGYAAASSKLIVTITDNNYDVNLMLACSIVAHLRSLSELSEILLALKSPIETQMVEEKMTVLAKISARYLFTGDVE